ncbi:hypothetical protein CMV_026763 [Castanea mollissima]|uniref:Uncharacterized protein n=1 Tax=Castanea mollissima TaxID=60419 RepID=A0A8J4VA35_9ROSI|nr:hypothetical protein CMV_026763 [Castanea mollissima]
MGFLGFRDRCGGMQPNRVEFEQEKMEGTAKLEGSSDDALWFGHCSMKMEGTSSEGGFEQMGRSQLLPLHALLHLLTLHKLVTPFGIKIQIFLFKLAGPTHSLKADSLFRTSFP